MKLEFIKNQPSRSRGRFFKYNFFPKNRKADIPVTILVIGVFSVCCLALLSFFISAINTRESFMGIDLMEKINSQIEENFFYGITGYSTDLEKTNLQRVIEYAKDNKVVNRKCNCGDKCNLYVDMIIEASNNNKITDPLLFLSLMMQESTCVPNAFSGSSVGLMQINLIHCGEYGLPSNRDKCKNELINNLELNLEIGAKILRENYDLDKGGRKFSGACLKENKEKVYSGWEAALRGYNGWGCDPTFVAQDNFVEDIMRRYNELKKFEGGYQEKKGTYISPEWGFNWVKEKTLFSVKYIRNLE